MFLKLDANNDGFLTHDELEAGMAEIAQIFQLDVPDVRSMLRSADINGDGRIDYTEFMAAAYQKDLLLSTENLQNAFKLFDEDGDGYISKEEIKKVFGGENVSAERGDQTWDDIMREVDKDNDGKISFAEFEAAMRLILNHRSQIDAHISSRISQQNL